MRKDVAPRCDPVSDAQCRRLRPGSTPRVMSLGYETRPLLKHQGPENAFLVEATVISFSGQLRVILRLGRLPRALVRTLLYVERQKAQAILGQLYGSSMCSVVNTLEPQLGVDFEPDPNTCGNRVSNMQCHRFSNHASREDFSPQTHIFLSSAQICRMPLGHWIQEVTSPKRNMLFNWTRAARDLLHRSRMGQLLKYHGTVTKLSFIGTRFEIERVLHILNFQQGKRCFVVAYREEASDNYRTSNSRANEF